MNHPFNGTTDTTVKCELPFRVPGKDSPRVTYSEPALNGTVASLECPPGLVLSGLDKVECNQQGEWEPDPNELNCYVSEDFSRGGDFLEAPLGIPAREH